MEKQNIRIKLRAYDNKILDASTEEIVNTVKRTGATIKGPVPLPTKIERYTVLRSPHIDKKNTSVKNIEAKTSNPKTSTTPNKDNQPKKSAIKEIVKEKKPKKDIPLELKQ